MNKSGNNYVPTQCSLGHPIHYSMITKDLLSSLCAFVILKADSNGDEMIFFKEVNAHTHPIGHTMAPPHEGDTIHSN